MLVLMIKRQRSSTFTLLLISRSYWFDKPRFVIEGKLLLVTSTPLLGAPPNTVNYAITDVFFFCHAGMEYERMQLKRFALMEIEYKLKRFVLSALNYVRFQSLHCAHFSCLAPLWKDNRSHLLCLHTLSPLSFLWCCYRR